MNGIARYAPLTGLASVALAVFGLVLFALWSDEPSADAPATELAAWLNDKGWEIFVSTWVMLLAGVLFLWFLGSLRSVLRRGEGAPGRVSAIATGAGIVFVTFYFASFVGVLSGAAAAEFENRVISAEAAEALYVIGAHGTFSLAEIAAGALVLATAIVVLRSTALPKWYGWLCLLYGLWLLVLPIGFFGFFGFPIWIVLTSGLVWMAESKVGAQAAAQG